MVMKRRSWIQPSDAAKYFGVPSSTIRQWIADGSLRAARLPTGHLRILARDVIKSLLEQGKAIPDELGNLANKRVLIVDPDKAAANALAKALRDSSGCKVTVADTAVDAKGLLNGARPDLVLLGVRQAWLGTPNNGSLDMLIRAGATEEPPSTETSGQAAAFRVNDILPTMLDERVIISRVANVLLG